MSRMGRGALAGSLLALTGLIILFVSVIPITSAEGVIDVSFTVAPGAKYGPNDPGTGYHTRILGKSVLKGDVLVEGEGIYLSLRNLQDVLVKERYGFTIDPADDLYVFIFDNIGGRSESFVRFRLEEVWTRPIIFSSPPFFILGLTGLALFPTGVIILVVTRLRSGPSKSINPHKVPL